MLISSQDTPSFWPFTINHSPFLLPFFFLGYIFEHSFPQLLLPPLSSPLLRLLLVLTMKLAAEPQQALLQGTLKKTVPGYLRRRKKYPHPQAATKEKSDRNLQLVDIALSSPVQSRVMHAIQAGANEKPAYTNASCTPHLHPP